MNTDNTNNISFQVKITSLKKYTNYTVIEYSNINPEYEDYLFDGADYCTGLYLGMKLIIENNFLTQKLELGLANIGAIISKNKSPWTEEQAGRFMLDERIKIPGDGNLQREIDKISEIARFYSDPYSILIHPTSIEMVEHIESIARGRCYSDM